jgi:hypothetical protein
MADVIDGRDGEFLRRAFAVECRLRERGAVGVRLVQDSFNTASLSLYASLGFEVKEPLALIEGMPKDEDMQALLTGAAAATETPLSFLLPTRQAALFRWFLSRGLRVVKPMTLMAMGEYREPRESFYPSVGY